MQTNLSLKFLQQKIDELQTALFSNMSTSVLRIPTSIIYVMKVDDAGQIWFCLPAPSQINEFERKFFCNLQFFRKGKDFYLKVNGKGFIVKDPEEMADLDFIDQDFKSQIIGGKLMLIKVNIQTADYFENKPEPEKEVMTFKGAQLINSVMSFVQSLRKQLFYQPVHQAILINHD